MRRLVGLLTVFALLLLVDVCGVNQVQAAILSSGHVGHLGECCKDNAPSSEKFKCCNSPFFTKESFYFSSQSGGFPARVYPAVQADFSTKPHWVHEAGSPVFFLNRPPQSFFLTGIFSHAPPGF